MTPGCGVPWRCGNRRLRRIWVRDVDPTGSDFSRFVASPSRVEANRHIGSCLASGVDVRILHDLQPHFLFPKATSVMGACAPRVLIERPVQPFRREPHIQWSIRGERTASQEQRKVRSSQSLSIRCELAFCTFYSDDEDGVSKVVALGEGVGAASIERARGLEVAFDTPRLIDPHAEPQIGEAVE